MYIHFRLSPIPTFCLQNVLSGEKNERDWGRIPRVELNVNQGSGFLQNFNLLPLLVRYSKKIYSFSLGRSFVRSFNFDKNIKRVAKENANVFTCLLFVSTGITICDLLEAIYNSFIRVPIVALRTSRLKP